MSTLLRRYNRITKWATESIQATDMVRFYLMQEHPEAEQLIRLLSDARTAMQLVIKEANTGRA